MGLHSQSIFIGSGRMTESLHDVYLNINDEGKTEIQLPESISIKDFEDWLNDMPNKKPLRLLREEKDD